MRCETFVGGVNVPREFAGKALGVPHGGPLRHRVEGQLGYKQRPNISNASRSPTASPISPPARAAISKTAAMNGMRKSEVPGR